VLQKQAIGEVGEAVQRIKNLRTSRHNRVVIPKIDVRIKKTAVDFSNNQLFNKQDFLLVFVNFLSGRLNYKEWPNGKQ